MCLAYLFSSSESETGQLLKTGTSACSVEDSVPSTDFATIR